MRRCSALAGTALLALTHLANANGDAKLHVMLQGESSDAMKELVLAQGGSITHELPIIDAVGANLDRGQLERVLETGLVARHIDDLAVDPGEEEEPLTGDCDVSGSLELSWQGNGFDWRLFNKREEAAVLRALELGWPPALGRITSITLDGQALPNVTLAGYSAGGLELELPSDKAPQLAGNAELQVRFQNSGDAVQHDIDAKLEFTGDCSTELVPGYVDNHENY